MQLSELLGLLRSLLIYYGIPGRNGRLRRFYSQFMQPGDLCFDIGAHVGNRLRAWSGLGVQMVAVEPQPMFMQLLKSVYGRSSHITLVEKAVGAAPGTADLHISRRHPTVTTMSQKWITAVQQDASFANVKWDRTVQVEVITLDNLIAQFGMPAFCKIDVEGFELAVLQGLTQPIPALSLEYIPATMEIAVNCVKHLAQLDDYYFNYSHGETHKMAFKQWLSPDKMIAKCHQLKSAGKSGDVYGRLFKHRTTDNCVKLANSRKIVQ
ncbi:MAG: FkbM family methyltransferase [Chloroflexi bacterium]|nr:FkbM family methyltransferase [Chloroflexota bacterium]